jgi:signal transduction histidine kinase/DNA-binding response OmpR family regulator/HAMP domain-containing protein
MKASAAMTTDAIDSKTLLKVLTDYNGGNFSARLPLDQNGTTGKIYDTLNAVLALNQARTHAEEALLQAGALQSAIFNSANFSSIATDAKGIIQIFNVGAERMLGYSAADVVNKITPAHISDPQEVIARARTLSVELGTPITPGFEALVFKASRGIEDIYELTYFRKDGSRFPAVVSVTALRDVQDAIIGYLLIGTDNTARKHAEAALREAEALQTAIFNSVVDVTTAVAKGDLSKKITVAVRGEFLELKNTINTMVDQLGSFASEVTRVAKEVGTEGKLGGQADVKGVAGTWKDLTDNVNFMASNLTSQVRNITDVTTAVANGDLSRKITVDVRGEMLELKKTINTMVDQLGSFAAEVTRVAREMGTDGKLGGQAMVRGAGGTWKDLTDSLNFMGSNLTDQLRNIAEVTTAVATGDLSKKITVSVRGEFLELKVTINTMVDQLSAFASEVTRVAREVGIEGRLGGQARVPGAAGTWRDLTDNVNGLAANLTTQVRAIADVATAVTKGDLSRSIAIDAAGEMASLKDNINQMIRNLKDTTQQNTEQDWLKTNLAKFTRLLQGQRDLQTVSRTILSELAPLVSMQHGVLYLNEAQDGPPDLVLLASYAYTERKHLANRFHAGQGLVGQCALEKKSIVLSQVPPDYVQISSGLGEAAPANIVVLPVMFEGQLKAVIELASFHRFSENHLRFLNQLTESIGIVLHTIVATMRTEDLLKQSQSLAGELQTGQRELTDTNARLEQQTRTLRMSEERLQQQQEELQQTNEELEEKAELMAKQKREVEKKNQEIDTARAALEEKAEQLSLTSKYKSEFLANMSHELRTPLNSLLILSRLLSQNADKNLTEKQVEFATTIFSSGSDLLDLISEILDLSKIESGTMDVDVKAAPFVDLRDYVLRTFNQLATDKGLQFDVHLGEALPDTIDTDPKRLQQVLKNLLSNALKFTDQGKVALTIEVATDGWNPDCRPLSRARRVIAFRVTDTGIGIPADKHRIIFEAFQQADGTTSRKYGGTGLGLSISREIARLLGGQVRLSSQVGGGSTFVLFLPQTFEGTVIDARAEPNSPRQARPPRVSSLLPESTPFDLAAMESVIPDDRATIAAGDRVLLIVEDDLSFAPILLDAARERGFKGVVAVRGDIGLEMARHMRPDAITLDIGLPMLDGWTVLDRLKHDSATRHIPVHIISATDEVLRGLKLGAIGHIGKPATLDGLGAALATIGGFIDRKVKNLLVVEDNDIERNSIVELIGSGDVQTTAVATGGEALSALEHVPFDCMVLDLGLSDMTGFDLLERMRASATLSQIPVIVYTGKELTKTQETELRRVAETIIIKDVKSLDRLLDETALFLHRVEGNLPEPKRKLLERLHHTDPALTGKKVLVVDDDIRNIFALTSVLEQYEMEVVYAENGKDAIEMLTNTAGIDVVLIDMMMPEMDGYEAMQAIRQIRKFKSLPMIALTAKAMKGDREKCIESGASDYVPKPVDTERLISLLRVWLYR